jgi:hypothetical protein
MDISRGLLGRVCLALCCSFSLAAQPTLGNDRDGTDGSEFVVPGPVDYTLSTYDADEVAAFDGTVGQLTGYGSDVGCGSACDCELSAPWTIPQLCLLQRAGIRVGGWLEGGITLNPYNADDGFNGPVATNDWDDEFQMNQAWVYLDRPADNGGCGWALGGHIDMIYGSDWRFGINHGLEDRINGFNFQRYGLVIPQMYAEVAYNNLSVKLGHFAGILDFEAVPAPMNPFYSHSYSYGYTVPQLVTGALADYKLTDRLSFQAGVHRGWVMFEDYNDSLDLMTGFKWVSPSERTKINYAISVGPQDPPADFNQVPGDQDRFVHSLVVQRQMTERLKWVLVQNFGTEQNAPAAGESAEWYGINQYFLYTINPCWTAQLRAEWMRDDDGVRIAGPGNIPGVYAWNGFGFAGNFFDITAGLNWRPNANWVIRPECRWDWYDGLANPNGDLPFDGGNEDDQFTFGVDAIVTF